MARRKDDLTATDGPLSTRQDFFKAPAVAQVEPASGPMVAPVVLQAEARIKRMVMCGA
jgi:hypothetical protein